MRAYFGRGLIVTLSIVVFIFASGCFDSPEKVTTISRYDSIPADAFKGMPDNDVFKPILHSDGWQAPVSMPGPITTAGFEDSPFITPDGNEFYFFFTPNASVPINLQLFDGITGVWYTKKVNGTWTEPVRIKLNNDVSLDGCVYVDGDTMWFGSARAGNLGEVDAYTAKYKDGKWTDWKNAGKRLNVDLDIGEFHLMDGCNTLYFGSSRPGGYGGKDIWVVRKDGNTWGEPVNLGAGVNSAKSEDQPFITPDGKELWFTGDSRMGYTGPAVFRSLKTPDGSWGPAEEIISNFAGEPTMDSAGNIYYIHHYFSADGKMLDADIYVAYRKI